MIDVKNAIGVSKKEGKNRQKGDFFFDPPKKKGDKRVIDYIHTKVRKKLYK